MEIFGTNLGITLSNKTLRTQVEQLGWTVQKIKFDSKLDRYTAEAKDETGLKLSRNGKTETLALSNLILAITKRHSSPRLSRWNTTFTNELADIAEAYSKAPLYEPKASIAFMELAKDSERRALVLADHLQIQVVNDPEPYKNPQKLADDVKKKRNLFVSRVGADHPLWSEQQVIAYRICHDVLGYVAADAGWDWAGENLAFAHHAALLSTEAQKALFSESVAQTAYATHYRAYGQQKVALFPQFLDKAQKVENPHDKHPGVHPSQSFPAVPLPGVKHIVESSEGEEATEAHRGLYAFGAFDRITWDEYDEEEDEFDGDWKPKLAVLGNGTINPNLQDPNANYVSPYQDNPIMTPNGQTLQQAYGDPMQVAETQANANLINTSNAPSTNGVEWAYLNQNDPGQVALMKKAIVNAFRVVLLSPRKDLRWNCHDDQTQALTDRGWLTIDELDELWTQNEAFKVAAYRDGEIVYETPEKMIVQDYNGDLIGFQGRLYDAMVTPNHRMLTTDGELIPAADVPIFRGVGKGGYGPLVPTAGAQTADRVDTFVVPGCDQYEPRTGCVALTNRARHEDREVPMDDWLRWLGWYISEGWIDRRRRAHVSQSINSPVLKQLQSACEALQIGQDYVKSDGMWVWNSLAPYTKPLGLWLLEHVGEGARNKRLPDFVFGLPQEQALVLLHTLLMGDGTADGNWTPEQGSAFYTSSTQLANDVHRLSVHCGFRSIVSHIREKTNEWKVSINPGRPTRLPKPVHHHYEGRVWCFTMPAGTMVTRRNGRVAITGNSVHYQHVSHIPAEVDDPAVYWDTLEKARQDWNVARGFGQYDHIPYMKQIPALVNVLYQKDYNGGYDAALKRSKELIRDWLTEEQNKEMRIDEEKPEAKRRLGFQIETKANYNLAKRLKLYLAESKPGLDHLITKQVKRQIAEEPIDTEQYRAASVWSPGDWGANDQPLDKGKYGAFMGNHLKSLAAISQHADNLLKAALEDVHEHDGTGHHFRAVVLQLGVPGVGPKVCSFAWLLLQPMTSELGTIDTHMMDLLGHKEKEMNNRDYFGMERELKAGRDAAGYSHVPLGQFQWGMWDYKRTGAGVHQDHSAMAVLDPKPHDSIDWAAKEQPIGAAGALEWKNMWQTQPPEWWAATQPARQEAWDDFRATQANKVAQGKVPWTNVPADYDPSVLDPNAGLSPSPGLETTSRVAMRWDNDGNLMAIPPMTPEERLAYVVHPQTGEHIIGRLGQSAMSHVMETMHHQDPREVWAADYDVGKELPMPPSIPAIPEASTPAVATF